MDYQGAAAAAAAIEPTYSQVFPWSAENTWSGFQSQVRDEQPITFIPLTKRRTQKQHSLIKKLSL